MALFHLGKKKEEKKASACSCGGICETASVEANPANTTVCCEKKQTAFAALRFSAQVVSPAGSCTRIHNLL